MLKIPQIVKVVEEFCLCKSCITVMVQCLCLSSCEKKSNCSITDFKRRKGLRAAAEGHRQSNKTFWGTTGCLWELFLPSKITAICCSPLCRQSYSQMLKNMTCQHFGIEIIFQPDLELYWGGNVLHSHTCCPNEERGGKKKSL